MIAEVVRSILVLSGVLLAVVVVSAVDGWDAVGGSAVGAVLVLVVLGFGSFTVSVVARAMPAASMLFALVTYVLQLVVLLAALVALSRSGAVGESLSRGWLGGTVIVGTLAWTAAQLWVSTKARIPAFDLPDGPR